MRKSLNEFGFTHAVIEYVSWRKSESEREKRERDNAQ
jgi:hypothetical protein